MSILSDSQQLPYIRVLLLMLQFRLSPCVGARFEPCVLPSVLVLRGLLPPFYGQMSLQYAIVLLPFLGNLKGAARLARS